MKAYKFNAILREDGWLEDGVITIDGAGLITDISTNPGKETSFVNGYAMPGFQNAHSHAFQYAMAGVAERHERRSADDFWSWRDAMYQVALTLDPEGLEDIAAMVYAEMVRHGYTHVAEFHYLHHDKGGKPYNNLAEHGQRLIAAAKEAGIKITLLPMFYQKGGFGKDPEMHQRRFISPTTEAYFKLVEASQKAVDLYNGARLGLGVHSLRAVQPEALLRTIDHGFGKTPFHLHIAEQLKEVEEATAFLQKRPVQWLLENASVNENFHLIHATHLLQEEVIGIARSGAHVVLCPSTEGNLGDGIFRLKQFQDEGGKWSIGTDSHIGLSPVEELRLLDYVQRVTSHKRDTFNTAKEADSGAYCYRQALISGRKAMGNQIESYLTIGQPLDVVVYDANAPLLAASSLDNLLSTIIYSGDPTMILGTMIDGQWKAKNNQHIKRQDLAVKFMKTIKKLKIR